jgi:hypothetical protein
MKTEKRVDSHIQQLHSAADGFIPYFAGPLSSTEKHSLNTLEETKATQTSDFIQ